MNSFVEGTVTILLAIVGLAMLSILVSRKSNTAGVIQAGASGFSNALGAATASVTGAELPLTFAYPNSNSGMFGY